MAQNKGVVAPANRGSYVLSLLATLLIGGAVAGADAQKALIREDFDQNRLDPANWSVERVGAQVDPGDGALRLVIPEGPQGRAPFGLQGLFRIEGDFGIQADYAIGTMPTPKNDWLNMEIFVEGAAGAAAVIRTNHAKEGSGYSLWYEAAGPKPAGAWKQVKTTDRSGTLRLERTGEELRFMVAGAGEKTFRELGRVGYGAGSITAVWFRVIVPETTLATDVAFDNIAIEADAIIGPPDPADSMFGPGALFAAALVTGCIGIVAFRYYRRIKRKDGPR